MRCFIESCTVCFERRSPRAASVQAWTARREPMTKSELIEQIAMRQPELSVKDVEAAVRMILDDITDTLADGGRVEIRGFGSFSLHYREPRIGRNPKTGEPVALDGKFVPHFKPGKELREQVDASRALGY
ncbi:integration host factor subunit beta [Halomonas sp. THAF12]|uniref:integration host factor subunit beta n=1 Tax=Halomonas sp. B23F22_10 TaxID=3459515 RepID=UPI00373EED68